MSNPTPPSSGWFARHGRETAIVAAVAAAMIVVFPLLHANGVVSDFTIRLWGKYLCYALLAISVNLLWGSTGLLSLGQALFFTLGGYMHGMYLMRMIGNLGQYKKPIPDFLVFLGWERLPAFWEPFSNFPFALTMAFLLPGLVAYIFGFLAFRSRIKGVYFSILTQALTYGAALLFFRNSMLMGGNNGFTDFKRLLGIPLQTPGMRMVLFVATGLALLGAFLLARWLVGRKFGRVLQAIRDAESRVMFSGYNPLPYKLTIWVISAMMCGVAGALYVPQVGIINPSEMSAAASIEIAIWTAVGGRATLVGPIAGAFIVNGAKSWLTVAYPEFWLYFLGALFIAVTLFLPDGIVGLIRKLTSRRSGEEAALRAASSAPAAPADAVRPLRRAVAAEEGADTGALAPLSADPKGARA